jgi:hypothetical protein
VVALPAHVLQLDRSDASPVACWEVCEDDGQWEPVAAATLCGTVDTRARLNERDRWGAVFFKYTPITSESNLDHCHERAKQIIHKE